MTTLKEELAAAPLGHATDYPDRYDASLLFAVPRAPQREELGIGGDLPFAGADVWTAYEQTWLDRDGKPCIAIVSFVVPVASPSIVESKSVKLYLGSFAQSRFAGAREVGEVIERDLSAATGAPVRVAMTPQRAFAQARIADLAGESLDDVAIATDRYEVDPLSLCAEGDTVSETLRSDLFRSVCPITGQPDYASVALAYRGPRIDRAGLLRYLVSYREHAGFHEHCAERIFVDVAARCRCEALTVNTRFTRRGGLDINPFRTNAGAAVPPNVRTPRQ
ncbi:MAG TPA: NADPH-dependent 7-cyano-7-deazaguanine reductase QueF [Casimicrobiaceae bacterium]|nr:NADPH-dependent 7-cyano-7-deazaguanine reductase QueF [Casimicrobiaceae bacterium]